MKISLVSESVSNSVYDFEYEGIIYSIKVESAKIPVRAVLPDLNKDIDYSLEKANAILIFFNVLERKWNWMKNNPLPIKSSIEFAEHVHHPCFIGVRKSN